MAPSCGIKFSISRAGDGWLWSTWRAADGVRTGGGLVATRAQAAAFAIRATVRATLAEEAALAAADFALEARRAA